MRIFQYLVAMSDIGIGLMALFLSLTVLLKPAEDAKPADRVAKKIELAKSKGNKTTKPDSLAASHLFVYESGKLVVRIPGEEERVFESLDGVNPNTLKVRGKIVVFAHRRVDMELLAKVLDLLRGSRESRSPPSVELAFIKE